MQSLLNPMGQRSHGPRLAKLLEVRFVFVSGGTREGVAQWYHHGSTHTGSRNIIIIPLALRLQ